MRPRGIETLITTGRPSIAPDGSFAVFATSRPDVTANRNVGQLWRIDLPDGTPRRITRGVADSAPQVSPDGSRIAFLRGDDRRRPQVFVLDAVGGEPVQATDAEGGVTGFAWSPDGATLAFTARVPERGRYGTVEGLEPAAEAPRRISGIRWHANGLGYMLDRPAQVFVIDAPDPGAEPLYTPAPAIEQHPVRAAAADARQLTDGPASHGLVVFTVDGTEILTVPDAAEDARRNLSDRVIAVAVDGSGQRTVLDESARLSVSDIAVAGESIALLAADTGESGVDFVAPPVGLWLLEADGPRLVTDTERMDLGEVGSHVTSLGDDFLVHHRTRGRVHLVRVARDGAVTPVLVGDVEVNGHAAVATAGGDVIVAAVATPTSLGEFVLAGRGQLTDFGAASASVSVVPEEVEIVGRDGVPVHGWVAKPAVEGPFPVILQIHGGPYAQYGIHLFDETQVLVEAGYAVVYCNPRGSAGYGRAHGRSIRQAMGTADFHDVMDFLDGVVAGDRALDGSRVGVMGGSYGGYLTAWVIAHDHRFAGAIVERGFLDPAAFVGTSDIGSFFGQEYVGTDPERIAAQSPMAVVSQVRTPTLVIHSELDFRCPLEQATRYYAALKEQGTAAEMLIFPGEDHELTRAGQPRHRVERFEAVLDWWRRHLPTD